MYGNEDGLINQIAAFSLTKSFGKVKTAEFDVRDVRKKPDFPKVDESLTTQDYGKDIKELEKLRNLTQKLKAENTALKAQNEKLKLLAEKALQQNKAKEKLAVELLKENEKLKLNNQIFKNKLLENENAELKQSIEHDSNKLKDKFALIVFLIIYILTVLGLTSLVASIYNRIRFRMATN
jgi:regulator of replication initiation timing